MSLQEPEFHSGKLTKGFLEINPWYFEVLMLYEELQFSDTVFRPFCECLQKSLRLQDNDSQFIEDFGLQSYLILL